MDGELGVQSSQEPTASTGTGSTFWFEITLMKAREEDLFSSSSPMRMARRNSGGQRVSFEQREVFFLSEGGPEAQPNRGEASGSGSPEGSGIGAGADAKRVPPERLQGGERGVILRGGEKGVQSGLWEVTEGGKGNEFVGKEERETTLGRTEAWEAVKAHNVVVGVVDQVGRHEGEAENVAKLVHVDANSVQAEAGSSLELDSSREVGSSTEVGSSIEVERAAEADAPKANLPPSAGTRLAKLEETKSDPAKLNPRVDTIVVCADPSLKVRQTVSQYLTNETIHVVTASSLRKALGGAAKQAHHLELDPGRGKDARVVVVALVSSALEKPKELPQVSIISSVSGDWRI
jgi:hypothetical protein